MESGMVNGKRVRFIDHKSLQSKKIRHLAKTVALAVEKVAKPEEHLPKDQTDLFVAMNAAAKYAVNSKGQTQQIWMQRWETIRQFIYQANIGMAHYCVNRYPHRDEEDVMSDAMFALGRSVECFDVWRGYQFSTYAMNCILRYLYRTNSAAIAYRHAFPVSLEPDMETPSESNTVLHDASINERKELISRIYRDNIANLTDRELYVLSERFPTQGESKSFNELAIFFGLSKERVRQIQKEAMQKIRKVVLEEDIEVVARD